jgi:hypothetical protein
MIMESPQVPDEQLSGWYKSAVPAEQKRFRTWLAGMLVVGPATVEFVKADGEVRNMLCTLEPHALPPRPPVTESTRTRKANDEALSVWCVDKQAWRSFRFDSIKSVSFNLGD